MGTSPTVSQLSGSVPPRQNKHCGRFFPGLNQANPKDPSSEKEDLVRFVAQGSTSVFLTPREIERESENDPELVGVRQYIHTRDWSKCKMPGYVSVKNELCTIGKLVLQGDPIVIPQSLRRLESAHEGHQGSVKTKSRLRTKVWWPKMDADAEHVYKGCHGCQVVEQPAACFVEILRQ